ncbi:MAG: hypothetical protein AAGA37_02195 [Actinomycetota bacterium]
MSLSDALRVAALERAQRSGQEIDGVVLEPDGVIDLRAMARDAGRDIDHHTIKLPILDGCAELDVRRPRVTIGETLTRRARRGPTANITVDLTTAEPVVDMTAAGDPMPRRHPIDLFGPGEACGHCGSVGHRDLLDRSTGRQYFSCDDCGHMWHRDSQDA